MENSRTEKMSPEKLAEEAWIDFRDIHMKLSESAELNFKCGFRDGYNAALSAKNDGGFDVEGAKAYGRKLFGGYRDTIGESYVLQAMRHQFEKDQSVIAQKDAEFASLGDKLSQAMIAVDKAQKLIAEKDAEILTYVDEIAALKVQHNRLHNKLLDDIELQKQEIAQLKAELANEKKRADANFDVSMFAAKGAEKLDSMLQAKDAEIAGLKEENELLRAVLAVARMINNQNPDVRMTHQLKRWDER